jgi:hypothetical protein
MQGTIRCEGCAGTGTWPTLSNPEAKHFECKGTGSLKEMSNPQINFIRGLFMELVRMQVIVKDDETWNRVVLAINDHKDGIKLQTSRWASNLIEELKARKNRHINKKEVQEVDIY